MHPDNIFTSVRRDGNGRAKAAGVRPGNIFTSTRHDDVRAKAASSQWLAAAQL
jgi:hypothetical protein